MPKMPTMKEGQWQADDIFASECECECDCIRVKDSLPACECMCDSNNNKNLEDHVCASLRLSLYAKCQKKMPRNEVLLPHTHTRTQLTQDSL